MEGHGGGSSSSPARRKTTFATGTAFKRSGAPPSAFRQGAKLRKRLVDPPPGVLPYVLLGGAAFCALFMPLYLLLGSGLPEPEQTFFPSRHGSDLPTKAVHDRPQRGEHFDEGKLVKETYRKPSFLQETKTVLCRFGSHTFGRTLGDRHHHTHVVVEFTDFFCPHCQEAHTEVMAPLIHRYVPIGRVYVESHPVAFLADDSMSASHAALCAQEQHKYWEMREVLFQVDLTNRTAAEAEDVDIFDAALYKRLGLLIGLDMRAFTKCLNTNRHHSEVRRISQLARDLGVHGTPSFLLNNKLVEGALQWSDIERMVAGRPPVSPGKRRLPHVPVNYSHPVLQARARAQAEAEMAAAAAEAEEAARAAAEAEQEGMCVDEGPIIRS